MFTSIIRNIVLVYAGIKSIFAIFGAGIKYIFKTTVTRILFFILLSFAIIWAIGFSIFYSNIHKNWEEIKSKNPSLIEKTDAIIVLTGGSERIRTALHLMENNYSEKMFISGVNEQVKTPELFAIHDISKEVFLKLINKVEVGFEARNTIENAKEIKNWITKNPQVKVVRLVTSNYHIDRALLELNSLLPDIKFIPHPVIPINVRIDKWWKFSGTRNLLFSEYNKLIAAYFRIYLEKI